MPHRSDPPLAPEPSVARRARPIASIAAPLCAAIAWLLTASRSRTEEWIDGTARNLLAIGAIVTAVGIVIAWRRRGWLDPSSAAAAAIVGALALAGDSDLPVYASIRSFGQSGLFLPLALALAVGSVVVVARRFDSDASFQLFIVAIAGGGVLFVRRADTYYPLLALLAAVAWLRAPRGSTTATPYVRPLLVFLGVSLLAVVTAVDRERHLAGWSRAALALTPIAVLGAAPSIERAWSATRAFGATVIASIVFAGVAIAEAAGPMGIRHALGARLPLFGIHPNLIAPFFAASVPLLIALAARGRLASRGLWSIVAVGALITLYLTRSRTALAAGAAGVGVLIALHLAIGTYRRRPRGSTAFWLCGAAVVGLVLVALVGRGIVLENLHDPSMAFRVYIWGVACDAIGERPWLGFGFLTGEPLSAFATPSDLDGRSKNLHPHSLPLALAMGAGWPAALLFLATWIGFVVRTTAVAASAESGARNLAIAVVASAVALMLTHLMDQGLCSTTPFPLHLGLLMGISASLITPRSPVRSGPARAWRFGAIGLAGLVGLAFAVTVSSELVSDRLQVGLKRRDVHAAERWSSIATALDPYDLNLGMQRVNALDLAGRESTVLDELRRLTETHPMSPVPWEAISSLESKRGRLRPSLFAIRRARDLDPTGPLAPEWSLRASRIELGLGDKEAAKREMALALRFDSQAARRVDWTEEAGDYQFTTKSGRASLSLTEVLAENRRLIPGLCREDPVKARRAASALAYTYRDFGFPREALDVIEEHKRLSGAEWPALRFLRVEIEEGMGGAEPVEAHASEGGFRELGGAWTLLAEGRRLVELGELEPALERFERGMDDIRDFAEEAEVVRHLTEEIFWLHLASGRLDRAEATVGPVVYARSLAAERMTAFLRLEAALAAAGRSDDARPWLHRAIEIVPYLRAGVDRAAIDAVADAIVRRVEPGGELEPLPHWTWLERSDAGLWLLAKIQERLGRESAYQELRERVRSRAPDWLR